MPSPQFTLNKHHNIKKIQIILCISYLPQGLRGDAREVDLTYPMQQNFEVLFAFILVWWNSFVIFLRNNPVVFPIISHQVVSHPLWLLLSARLLTPHRRGNSLLRHRSLHFWQEPLCPGLGVLSLLRAQVRKKI